MGSGRAHEFELVINKRCIRVLIYPMGGSNYRVAFGHHVGYIGEIRREEKPRRFVCKDRKSGREYGGTTRQQAVTAMIYDCYPDGDA
jgi:hypothetical protein